MTNRWQYIFDKDLLRQRYRTRLMRAAERRAERRRAAAADATMVTQIEFAAMWRVSVDTVQRTAKRRPEGFPREFAPTPRRRTYLRSDVEAWIASRALW